MRKRWSINVFKVLDLSLANTFKMYMHSYKNGLWREKVVKQCDGSCFREDVDVQSIPPSVLVLSVPAIYNLAARSITSFVQHLRGPHPCRPKLWTSESHPPFSDRPIVAVLENHQLTDLLFWALAELRRGYSLIELHSKTVHLLFGSSIIYCTGTSVNAAVNVLLLLKEIWIGQLLWADSLQHSHPNDSVWWYMTKTDWTPVFKTSWELDFLSCSNHSGSVKTILFYISVLVFLCFPDIAFYTLMGNLEISCTVWVSCYKHICFFHSYSVIPFNNLYTMSSCPKFATSLTKLFL